MIPQNRRASLLICLALFAVGCGEDTAIRSYTVSKKAQTDKPQGVPDRPAQLLGAIVPHQQSAWFLKLTDEPEKVVKIAEDFWQLASSLSFNDDGTPQWNLAEGWNERVLGQITYAQFSNPDGATVTLTQLGANTSDTSQWQTYLQDNINRWREQLSLSPLDWQAIEPQLEELSTHSTETAKAYFVSMVGRQSSAGAGPMRGGQMRGGPMRGGPVSGSPTRPDSQPLTSQNSSDRSQDAGVASSGSGDGRSGTAGASANPAPSTSSSPIPPYGAPKLARKELVYQVPEGWQEQPSSGIRLAYFLVSDEPDMGTVSVSTAGGQLEQSIAMWLQEVKVEPEQDRVSQVVENAVHGEGPLGRYQCFTVLGDSDEKDHLPIGAIRVAVIPLNEQENLFVKMRGTKELIASESSRMDQFIESLNW